LASLREKAKKGNRMGEGIFTYKAENGNVCEIVDTFAETFTLMEISPAKSLSFSFFKCIN
jgi:hypothetical protein